MKKLLCSILILIMTLTMIMGCAGTPSNSPDGTSANAPTVKIYLPDGVCDSFAENEISVFLNENFTDNNLTSSFEIMSSDAELVTVNGASPDFTLEWNGERNVVLKVRLADGATDTGKFKIVTASSWVEVNGVSDYSLTHSVTKDIFYATKNGKIAFSLKSESDALEKLN